MGQAILLFGTTPRKWQGQASRCLEARQITFAQVGSSRSRAARKSAIGPSCAATRKIMLGGFQEIEFDFVADNPGRTLFHCHQQLHMDFGYMALFDYA